MKKNFTIDNIFSNKFKITFIILLLISSILFFISRNDTDDSSSKKQSSSAPSVSEPTKSASQDFFVPIPTPDLSALNGNNTSTNRPTPFVPIPTPDLSGLYGNNNGKNRPTPYVRIHTPSSPKSIDTTNNSTDASLSPEESGLADLKELLIKFSFDSLPVKDLISYFRIAFYKAFDSNLPKDMEHDLTTRVTANEKELRELGKKVKAKEISDEEMLLKIDSILGLSN